MSNIDECIAEGHDLGPGNCCDIDCPWSQSESEDDDLQVGSSSAEVHVTLFDADTSCDHEIVQKSLQEGGGFKCTKCRGWFCY